MAAGNELGITAGQPYGGWSDYIGGGFSTYITENPKFIYIADTFPRLRMIANVDSSGGTTYPNANTSSIQLWSAAVKAQNPSCYILYGDTGNRGNGYLPNTYATYNTYLLQDAAWAQANLMDAFCVGNENLISAAHSSVGMTMASLSRLSNVATATFSSAHGLTNNDYVWITGATPTTFNVADSESSEAGVQVTVLDSTTVTYPNTGVDQSATGTIKMNWTAYEVVRKTKAQAALAQAVFTRGPIVYSESQGHTTPWINLGITPGTNIDLMAHNGYGSGDEDANYIYWKNEIDALFSAFSTNLILTEFNITQDTNNAETHNNFLNTKVGAQDVYDMELVRRYNYAKGLGITQIYLYGANAYTYFCNTWPSTTYGYRYIDGYYTPSIDRIKGKRVTKVFYGTHTLT